MVCPPVHPGEILREELEELGMSAKAIARELGVPQNRVSDILRGRRGITADTALRLARYLNTTPQLWLNLQKAYELRVAELEAGKGHCQTSETKTGGCLVPWHTKRFLYPNNLTR